MQRTFETRSFIRCLKTHAVFRSCVCVCRTWSRKIISISSISEFDACVCVAWSHAKRPCFEGTSFTAWKTREILKTCESRRRTQSFVYLYEVARPWHCHDWNEFEVVSCGAYATSYIYIYVYIRWVNMSIVYRPRDSIQWSHLDISIYVYNAWHWTVEFLVQSRKDYRSRGRSIYQYR